MITTRTVHVLSISLHPILFLSFFFNDTATTEIYTLSLHDALPISRPSAHTSTTSGLAGWITMRAMRPVESRPACCQLRPASRSEEHTSELQSQSNLVCRLLLEKKNTRCT